jgi:Domain of unknown function (DUF1835)
MARTLHVTNGNMTGDTLARVFPVDDLIVWRDVLHEGPAPTGITDSELREIRAAFLASQGWGAETDLFDQFATRDATLARYGDYEEVVLWFEHDLYDQLQLIQILDRLPGQSDGETTISLICIDSFPGVEPFHGLGQLDEEQLASLYPSREPVTDDQLILARNAWAAFREPNPSAIEHVLEGGTNALPFLSEALYRHLEQFPGLRDGLSRTERQTLEALLDGPKTPNELFAADQEREEHRFLGDLTFYAHMQRLGESLEPLLKQDDDRPLVLLLAPNDLPAFRAQRAVMTERGRDVLAGKEDWASGPADRWLGGVFLQAGRPGWRWDPVTRQVRFPD